MDVRKDQLAKNKARRGLVSFTAALLFGASLAAQADLDILVVGSTRSFSDSSLTTWNESNVVHQAAFNPSNIAVELQSILDQDSAITETVNVVFDDIYKSDTRYVQTSKDGYNTWQLHCYSLAQHFMWPAGKTNRLANLRGADGTAWDYVVIMADPYIMGNFPGMYTEGAKMLIDEVRAGTAEPILMAQWPETNSIFSVSNFNEAVYRTGDSADVRVVPAGKAWDSLTPKTPSASHPTPDGAYLAAASIYAELYSQSATNSSYTYDNSIADHALSVVQTNQGVSQYSGAYTNLTPFTMKYVYKRLVSYRQTGTSTENGIQTELTQIDTLYGIDVTSTATHDPTDWDFNYGRGNDRWEDNKDYEVNPALYDRAYGFPMHYYGMTNAIRHMQYGIDKQNFDDDPWYTYEDGTDLGIAYNMIRPFTREDSLPADVRCIPIRLMWAKMAALAAPGLNPLGDNTHMAGHLNNASAAFMLTLLSGRCPITDEPTPQGSGAWNEWLGQKIGYETAWQMAHLTTRAPGFQVLPTSTTATNVTPTNSQTLSVRFRMAPTSDVTVAVTTDDAFAGKVSPSVLTFTPANYTNIQTVTVLGETGAAGGYEFNVVLTTSSSDFVYDGITDKWDFFNTRPEGPVPSDIRVLGNGNTILSGANTPDPADGTHFGVTSGSVTQQFVITNLSASTTINLTNSPRVTVTSAGGHFTLSQDAVSGSIGPNGSTTFDVAYTPLSGGSHSATVTVASTDANLPLYSIAIAGIRPAPPTVIIGTVTSSAPTSATLSGQLTAGGSGQAWICWGTTDGGNSSTGDWGQVISIGSVNEGIPFDGLANGLLTNATYWFRCYVSNAFGEDWSDSTASFNGEPVGAGSGSAGLPFTSNLVLHLDADDIDGDGSSEGLSETGLSGSTVNTWDDKSIDDNDATRQNGSPILVPNALNGRSVVRTSDDTSWFEFTDITDIRTVFWVVTESSAATDMGFLLGDDNRYHFHRDSTKGDLWHSTHAAANIKNGTTRMDGVAINGESTAIPSDQPSLITLVTAGNVEASRVTYDRTYTRSWQGDIAEIVIYDAVLSTEDEEAVGGYLAWKWGLSSSYPEYTGTAPIANLPPTSMTETQATLNASLDATGTNFTVDVFWGTTDAGTNVGSWANSMTIGSWTGVTTSVSYTPDLLPGETYYYTFRASSAGTNVWASPSWRFTMPGTYVPPTHTSNHSVPYAWLNTIDSGWSNDYEAAVLADQDGDGFLTWEEYWSGTDPMNSNSHLRVDTILYDGTNVMLRWQHAEVDPTIPSINIEASTNLLLNGWITVGTNVPVNGTNVWMNVSSPGVFFRLVATNAP